MNANAKQTEFTLKAPSARKVLLAGDFTHWLKNAVVLHREENGFWAVNVRLVPGTYHYKFIVDGRWCDDPACKRRVRNSFGTQNELLQV